MKNSHEAEHEHEIIRRLDSMEKRQKKMLTTITGCNKKLDTLLRRVVSSEELQELTEQLKASEKKLLASFEAETQSEDET